MAIKQHTQKKTTNKRFRMCKRDTIDIIIKQTPGNKKSPMNLLFKENRVMTKKNEWQSGVIHIVKQQLGFASIEHKTC